MYCSFAVLVPAMLDDNVWDLVQRSSRNSGLQTATTMRVIISVAGRGVAHLDTCSSSILISIQHLAV